MRSTERGFTLLEVVVAIALLSAITVTALPLLVEATRATLPPVSVVGNGELGAFADEVMRDDATVARIAAASEVRFSWRDAPRRPLVVARHVQVLMTTDGSVPHDWIEFRCDAACVWRYRRIVEERASDAEPPP